MKGYVSNIEKETLENEDFRRVLYTGKNSQLVLMSLEPNEEIGMEVHTLDQFIRIEEGVGEAIIDEVSHPLEDGSAVVIPAGANHNILNKSGDKKMKLYTIYSPAEHQDGIVRHTKADAEAEPEEFDGKTTE